MNENFETNRDTKPDSKPDVGSGSGGELANDAGVDLNAKSDDGVTMEKATMNGVGEDLNKCHHGHLNSNYVSEVLSAGLDVGKKVFEVGLDIGANITNTLISMAGKQMGKVKTESDSSLSKVTDVIGDSQRLDDVLDNFQEDQWRDSSLEEQKQSMTELADYVADETGNKNPPEIVFRADMDDGAYGGYNPDTNTLEINQNMLDDSAEVADTVAHEMWHAYQRQCAMDPTSEKGREYQEGIDNYISPEYDFEGYENQMIESEAREYAYGFKDRIKQAA